MTKFVQVHLNTLVVPLIVGLAWLSLGCGPSEEPAAGEAVANPAARSTGSDADPTRVEPVVVTDTSANEAAPTDNAVTEPITIPNITATEPMAIPDNPASEPIATPDNAATAPPATLANTVTQPADAPDSTVAEPPYWQGQQARQSPIRLLGAPDLMLTRPGWSRWLLLTLLQTRRLQPTMQ